MVYRERALFVVGDEDTGKSSQLRSMFLDRRLGNNGAVPRPRNATNIHHLSNERGLYIRYSSPHETRQTFLDFIAFLDTHLFSLRCNFAGALQAEGNAYSPDVVTFITDLQGQRPFERIRVLLLSPDQNGDEIDVPGYRTVDQVVRALWRIPNVEVAKIDARNRRRNGLLIADFFDFT